MARVRLLPIGFWSYTRRDDQLARGKLADLRALIVEELEAQLGEQAPVFKDTISIPHGARWEQMTRKALADSTFFIPILTPNFLMSEWCCREVQLFFEREQQLGAAHPELAGRSRMFPIHYIDATDADARDEGVVEALMELQHLDFREMRHRSCDEAPVRSKVAAFVTSIRDLMRIRVEILDSPPAVEPPKRKPPGSVKPAPVAPPAVSEPPVAPPSPPPADPPLTATPSPLPAASEPLVAPPSPSPAHPPPIQTPSSLPAASDDPVSPAGAARPGGAGKRIVAIGIGVIAIVGIIIAILASNRRPPLANYTASASDTVDNYAADVSNVGEPAMNGAASNVAAAAAPSRLVAESNCGIDINLYVSWWDGASRMTAGPWLIPANTQRSLPLQSGGEVYAAPGDIYYYGISPGQSRIVQGSYPTEFVGLGQRYAAYDQVPSNSSGEHILRFNCQEVSSSGVTSNTTNGM